MRSFKHALPLLALTSSFALTSGLAFAAGEEAEKPKKERLSLEDMPYNYALQPEGKTLPEGVLRVRLPYQDERGTKQFDSSGKSVDTGFRVSAAGGAIALEYGVNDRISVQFLSRYMTRNNVTIDSGAFQNTSAFSNAKAATYASQFSSLGSDTNSSNLASRLQAAVAATLAKNGACGTGATASSCLTAIQNGAKAPAALTAANTGLPGLNIPAGAPIGSSLTSYATAADAAINDGILAQGEAAQRHGATGLSDTEIGALYELIRADPVFFSVGLGLRLPTARCTGLNVNETATGRCVTELGLRTNLDLLPLSWLMVNWQNQAETMIAKGKVTSGDREVTVERNGVRNEGFIYIKPALNEIHPSLKVLAPKVGITYDFDSGESEDGKEQPHISVEDWVVGLGFDFTRYNIPLQLDVDYNDAFAGKNTQILTHTITPIASSGVTVTLRAFAMF